MIKILVCAIIRLNPPRVRQKKSSLTEFEFEFEFFSILKYGYEMSNDNISHEVSHYNDEIKEKTRKVEKMGTNEDISLIKKS